MYDGSKVYLYIDGVIDGAEDANGYIDNGSYNVCIGENLEELGNREWEGLIDDVRVYHEALSHANIVYLADKSWIYQPVVSLANIYNEEAKYSRSVNFRDLAEMANNWLEELLFPFE